MKVQKQLSTSFLIICHRKLILMTSKPNGSYGDRQQTWNLEPVDLTRTNHSVTQVHSVKVEPTVLVQFKSRAVREKVTRGRKIVKSLPCSIAEDLTTVNLQILNRFNKILIAWKNLVMEQEIILISWLIILKYFCLHSKLEDYSVCS